MRPARLNSLILPLVYTIVSAQRASSNKYTHANVKLKMLVYNVIDDHYTAGIIFARLYGAENSCKYNPKKKTHTIRDFITK